MKRNRKTKEDYTKEIVEYPQEKEEIEDSLSVYRDMFLKTEDERIDEQEEDTNKIKQTLVNLNLTKKTDDWTDNPSNLKFQVGDLVITKRKTVYKVVGFSRYTDTYMVKASQSEFEHPEKGIDLEPAPEGSKWEPIILDPYKLWKMQQEKKKNGN